MANVNKVILIGNLTRDPELKYLPSQTAVCEFGLAVNRTWTGTDGIKKEEVTFVDCSAFGRQAETLQKYVKKGNPLFIEGRLKLDQWEAQDGSKRSKMRVVIENFQFLGGPRTGEQAGSAEYAGEPATAGGGGGGGAAMPHARKPHAPQRKTSTAADVRNPPPVRRPRPTTTSATPSPKTPPPRSRMMTFHFEPSPIALRGNARHSASRYIARPFPSRANAKPGTLNSMPRGTHKGIYITQRA